MKSILSLFFIVIFFTVLISSSTLALRKLDNLSKGLPKGIKVYKYRSDDKRAVLYVAELDRRHFPGIQFKTGVARGRVLGRATVRDTIRQATRNGKNVLIAVNGSFGTLHGNHEGVIHNLHIQNGMLVSPPNRYACFGVTKSGEFLMEDLKMNISVEIAGRKINVRNLNERRNGSTALYTPKFGYSTQTRKGCEVTIRDVALPLTPNYKSRFTVSDVRDSGETKIPRKGFVLSAKRGSDEARFFSDLKEGEEGELIVSLSPKRWNDVEQAIGGNSRLLKNGELCDAAHRGRNARKDDPRTALGYNDRKLFLMVVDGRQGGYSRGMTYNDVAEAMKELGATESINLDGGSSSTFIVNNKVINRPSGGKERHVLNAVFIVSR